MERDKGAQDDSCASPAAAHADGENPAKTTRRRGSFACKRGSLDKFSLTDADSATKEAPSSTAICTMCVGAVAQAAPGAVPGPVKTAMIDGKTTRGRKFHDGASS